jgi:hypothetical protein
VYWQVLAQAQEPVSLRVLVLVLVLVLVQVCWAQTLL